MSGAGGDRVAPRYPRPPILDEIPIDRHAVIEASAGTGKTYTLEHLVAEILLQGKATIGQILMVTFTEKAAAELRMRVRRLLAQLLAAAQSEGKPEEEEATEKGWLLDSEARERLGAALRDFDGAVVCTIHAFCRQALTEHAFANGRLFDEQLADGDEQLAAAFREVLRREGAVDPDLKGWLRVWAHCGRSIEELESLLGSCQKLGGAIVPALSTERVDEALTALPALEVLVAACERLPTCSGKVCRAVELIDECRKAWRASEGQADADRYRAIVPIRLPHPEMTQELPRPIRYALAKLRDALDTYAAGGPKRGKPLSAPEAAALERIEQALLGLERAVPPPEPAVAARFLPALERALVRRKRERGLFDFQDMLALVDESLGREESPLLAALRARFRFALIDEFQDTDAVQWRIFRRLFFQSGEGHVLHLIGDPKQAIYRFRGADIDTYLAAKTEVREAGGALVRLDENRRSTPQLVAAYNRVLDQQGQPPFFKGTDIRYDDPVRCASGLRLVGEERPPIQVLVTDSSSASAEVVLPKLGRAIADEIHRLVPDGEPRLFLEKEGRRRPIRYGDVYVLAFKRRELLAVAEQLRAAGIPHAFYKQGGLFQSPEALHLEVLLQAVADPDDRARCFRAWLTPFFGLRLRDLERAGEVPPSDPLVLRLRQWSELAQSRDYEALFRAIIEGSGLVRRLVLFDPGERALTNYQHLVELLRQQFASRRASVEEMANGLRAWRQAAARPAGEDQDLQRLETERDAVQLLTMHMSKGLEAAVVFVAGGFTKGQPPGTIPARPVHLPQPRDAASPAGRVLLVGSEPRPLAEQAADEEGREEERLLYVSLTRAKARLYLPFLGTCRASADAAGAEAETSAQALELEAAPRANGCYSHVNGRLEALLREHSTSEAVRADLGWERLPADSGSLSGGGADGEGGGRGAAPRDEPSGTLSGGRADGEGGGRGAAPRVEPSGTLSGGGADGEGGGRGGPPWIDPDEQVWNRMRPRHAGYATHSFSSLSAHHGSVAEDAAEETKQEADDRAPPPPHDLPGGATTGSFLHEVLAAAPPEAARAARTVEQFAADPRVARLFETFGRKFGIDPRHRPAAERIVYTALAAPIDLGGTLLPGIASAERVAREMEFLYPVPEECHPRIDALPEEGRRPFEIHRGYVVGFVDLLFEHRGLTYFGDWKSNSLRSFDADGLAAGFKPYELQARLYTLALVKLLGLRDAASYDARFGGLLFLFLRGMKLEGRGDDGVVFRRPRWSEVVGWEQELMRHKKLGRGVA